MYHLQNFPSHGGFVCVQKEQYFLLGGDQPRNWKDCPNSGCNMNRLGMGSGFSFGIKESATSLLPFIFCIHLGE
jgi:hypothetical protein